MTQLVYFTYNRLLNLHYGIDYCYRAANANPTKQMLKRRNKTTLPSGAMRRVCGIFPRQGLRVV